MSSALFKRLLVAGIGIPAAFAVVWLGGLVLAGVIGLLGGLGAAEVYRLARQRDVWPLEAAGVTGAALAAPLLFAAHPAGLALREGWVLLGGALWLVAVMLVAVRWRSPARAPLSAISVTVFGAVYAGGLPAFLIWMRHATPGSDPRGGTGLVFLPLAVTWVCDTLAMTGGAAIGGAKLAPLLSPKKTWAGFLAGAVGAVIVAPLYGRLVLAPLGQDVPLAALALVGLGIGTLGQLGDLAESLLKREVGLKDSGGFFPGHGGVLDRLDSLYWGIPVTAMVLRVCGVI